MNPKHLVRYLVIVGLLLAVGFVFFTQAAHRRNNFFHQVIPNETKAAPDVVSMPHPVPLTPALNRDSSLRTWRPSAVDAYRNSERAGYAWILRQMGMSESDLDRLASGEFAALLKDLITKADQGDRNATLSLGWLAWRCLFSRSEDQLNDYQQSQLQSARLLPPGDAEWFTSFLNQDIDTEKQRTTECAVIDQDRVKALLTGLSQQGDGASTFMLAQQAGNMSDEDRLARRAALQGFPEAQYEWGLVIRDGGQGFWHPQPGDPSAVDFLRGAADELATARASLAICEYRGCGGEAPNPEKAIVDARTAAQQGDPDALMNLANTAPPSFISPVEAQAWALFDVALQQRGCRVNSVSVNWMRSMAAQTAKATSEAQTLADQDWQLYGASAMQRLGC